MWRPLLEDRGDPAAQGSGSAVAKVSDLCGGGVLPSALPEVRVEGGSGSAVAEQGAVQQGLRRRGGSGVRVRGGPASGAAVWIGGGDGASNAVQQRVPNTTSLCSRSCDIGAQDLSN